MLKDMYTRAMVTGGAGFIGSHIAEELLKQGLEVITVDDYSAGKHDNVAHLHDWNGYTEAKCDITDRESLKKCMENVDIIFHEAASKKNICLKDPLRDLAVNGGGAYTLYSLASEMHVKKAVHASTGSVFGETRVFPQTEEHPLNPVSYYGISKLAGEKYARAFVDLYDLNTTVLRYYHVFGPRQEYSELGGVINIFGRKILHSENPVIFGDGTQQRSFTYVGDLVKINMLVAQLPQTKGEAYNCPSGYYLTINELAKKELEYFGRTDLSIEYQDWLVGDIKTFDVDNSKVRSLGFEFDTDFDKNLGITLDWLRDYLAAKERA